MKIKAFLTSGRFTIIKVFAFDDLKNIASKYTRWEYVS